MILLTLTDFSLKAGDPYEHNGTLYTVIEIRNYGRKTRMKTFKIGTEGERQEYLERMRALNLKLKSKKKIENTMYTVDYYAKTLKSDCQSRCKRRKKGVVEGLTKEWFVERLKGTCALTNLPFVFEPGSAYAPSLDRIDSTNPNYTPDNCRIVLFLVNCALNKYGETTAFPILKALVKCIESRELKP